MTEGEFDSGGVSLDDPKTIEALVRYDDLPPEELERFERDPVASSALERLRAADRWLEGQGPIGSMGISSSAPSPEELYDYGGGPGASPLSTEARETCAAHLNAHPEERPWVAGLSNTPPSPVIRGVDDEASPTQDKRSRAWLAWAPLAAAALVIAMILGGTDRRNVLAGGLPASPVLRSAAAEGGLLFPRGRVLSHASGTEGFAAQPLFEVVAVENASAYTFELRRLTGDVFETGEIIWTSRSTSPKAIGPALAKGAFEWEARAIVNDLPRRLGTMSFEVEERAALSALVGTACEGDEDTKRAAIHRLHASGFLTDARAIARTLPPTKERAAYISGQ